MKMARIKHINTKVTNNSLSLSLGPGPGPVNVN